MIVLEEAPNADAQWSTCPCGALEHVANWPVLHHVLDSLKSGAGSGLGTRDLSGWIRSSRPESVTRLQPPIAGVNALRVLEHYR